MASFPSRVSSHARLLGRMMRVCGVDAGHFSHDRAQAHLGLSFITVARACMACPEVESCRAWLETAEREGLHDPPAFCPNAARFRAARDA